MARTTMAKKVELSRAAASSMDYQADGQADAKRNPNASEDDRNPDLSIFSAALSQLSYRGKLLCFDV